MNTKKRRELITLNSRCAIAVCTAGLSAIDWTAKEKGLRRNINSIVPIALKRKLAKPTLLACRLSLEDAINAVILEPRLAPKTIGIATFRGINPL